MIYIILGSLKRQRKKNFLILIQFFIGFFALFYAIAMIENVLRYEEQITRIVPENAIQLVNYEDYGVDIQEENIESYGNCIENIQKITESRIVLLENKYFEVGDSSEEMEGLVAYYDTLAITDFQLMEGSVDELIHYDGGNVIPVLVTEEMAKTYPFGSKFDAQERNDYEETERIRCCVAGVISSDMKYWKGNTIPISDSVRKCDDSWFLMPAKETCNSLDAYVYNTVVIPKVSEEGTLEQSMEEIFEKEDLSIAFVSIREQIDEFYQGQKMFIFTVGCFSVILLLLATLGCIGTILASIMQRKEEFGIYVTLGFTKRKLAVLLFGELLFLFFGAFVLSMFACAQILSILSTTTGVLMNLRIMAIGFLVMLVCMMLSAVGPIRRIYSFQPIELMEGRR